MVFTACFLVESHHLSAQATDPKDPVAKAILDDVSAKTRSYAAIKATFIYALENKTDNIHETQQGTLLLKGAKYRLEVAGQQIISDGKTRWTYLPDAKEVHITEPEKKEEEINPSNIFTIYESGFKYRYKGEQQDEGKTIQLIDLYPVEATEKSYHTVQLTIDKQQKRLTAIRILQKDGNHVIYKIKEFTPNPPAKDSDFTFNPAEHPGVEVIDLR